MNGRNEPKELKSSIVSVSTKGEINLIIKGIKNPLCECFPIKTKLNSFKTDRNPIILHMNEIDTQRHKTNDPS